MGEIIRHRRSFLDYDPSKTAYITYELPKGPPDFSTYVYGSEHSIVLRNKKSGELESIDFIISGDDGKYFDKTRCLWGDIVSDDYHTILVFSFSDGKLDKITASFCGSSMPHEAYNRIVEKASYAAAATANDLYFWTHQESLRRS